LAERDLLRPTNRRATPAVSAASRPGAVEIAAISANGCWHPNCCSRSARRSKINGANTGAVRSAILEERRSMGLVTAMILMLAVLGLGHSAGSGW
jgi:hypothetical protein